MGRAPAHALDEPSERQAAGRLMGLLWLVGGISGALWYLVPGAEMEHWQLGLITASFSATVGAACALAPWKRMSSIWIYVGAGLSLVVIPVVMAINGGAESPTVLYLFMASALFGYFLSTRAALAFLAVGTLIPATPMLYDPAALEPTFIARCVLTAPIYMGVGLVIVLAKRQLVTARNESRRQALHDPLTGLANRRALTEAIRDSRAGERLALVLIDVDNFKLANTLHGYSGGDAVLRCVADVLRRETRQDDLVARLGGDEFALLVSGARDEQLVDLCRRLVAAIRAAKRELDESRYELTASVGFALLEGGDADELLEAADLQLARAKQAGKDRFAASAGPIATVAY